MIGSFSFLFLMIIFSDFPHFGSQLYPNYLNHPVLLLAVIPRMHPVLVRIWRSWERRAFSKSDRPARDPDSEVSGGAVYVPMSLPPLQSPSPRPRSRLRRSVRAGQTQPLCSCKELNCHRKVHCLSPLRRHGSLVRLPPRSSPSDHDVWRADPYW